MSMRDLEYTAILLCLWGMHLADTIVVIMVCMVMELMWFRKHVNSILKPIKKGLSSNGVLGVITVFQTSRYILGNRNKVALYV